MRCYISVVCALSVLAALSCAAPASSHSKRAILGQASALLSVGAGGNGTASLVEKFQRNIQLLRQLCPPLFQVIDTVVQNITSQIFRVVGRVILQSGGLGGGSGGGGGGSGGESRVSVVLPTFPPDDDEDDEDEEDTDTNQVQTTTTKETSFDVRTISRKPNTSAVKEVALRVNEISDSPTENALFTGAKESDSNSKDERDNEIIENRFGANTTTTTTTTTTQKLEITTEFRTTETPTETEEDKPRTTEISTDNPLDTNEVPQSSLNAILNGVIQVKYNNVDENSFELDNITTTNPVTTNADSEVDESEDTKTTTENSVAFVIKVIQNGDIINTIPLATESTTRNEVDENGKLYTSPVSASATVRARRTIREAGDEDQDQEAAASGGNGPSPADDLSNVDAEDADRDKRYLPFGGGDVHASGGGSGNFLFDIIRQTADGAARAAGTIYRMVAGTESLGIGLTASSQEMRTLDASAAPQLIAGSGATEETDEKENAPVGAGGIAEVDVAKAADGYTEGIPGPITRLFVIANRGLANLVQDLILRLAQTSERIVNFKARLITALI